VLALGDEEQKKEDQEEDDACNNRGSGKTRVIEMGVKTARGI